MEHLNYLPYSLEFVIWDIEPVIEGVGKLGADLFPGVLKDVLERL